MLQSTTISVLSWETEGGREGGKEVRRDRWGTGGKNRGEKGGMMVSDRVGENEGERRKEKACGGSRGGIGRNGVGGGGGGVARREERRSYECWPLSLYINLHINCIKWGSPCFLIFSSLTMPFFSLSATHTHTSPGRHLASDWAMSFIMSVHIRGHCRDLSPNNTSPCHTPVPDGKK